MKPDLPFRRFITKLSVIGLLVTGSAFSMVASAGYDAYGYTGCRPAEIPPASQISIDQAYGVVRNLSHGIPITADFEWGMSVPVFNFTVLEGPLLRHFKVNAETGEIHEHASEAIDHAESAPEQTLADAILAAMKKIQGHVLYAELAEANETLAYKVGIQSRGGDYSVFVSASSGKVLLTTTESFDNFGASYPQSEAVPASSRTTNLGEVITTAENAVSGRAVSVNFVGAVFFELDGHLKPEEKSNHVIVNVIANKFIHTVIVDGDSNQVIEIAKNEYQLLLETLAKSKKLPLGFVDVINIAQGKERGRFTDAWLHEEDGRLYYGVGLNVQDDNTLLFIDAISGTVKTGQEIESAVICSEVMAGGLTN